jgi:RND superfamily putative drug exporter
VATPVTKGDRSLVSATLKGDAYSPRAAGVIKDVRKIVHGIPGADAAVGGTSATNLDIQNASHRDDEVIIPLTVLVVLLILGLLLRALVAPVILIATVVLSFAAAMGLSALVFHYIFGFGGADSSLPLFVFVFLVALGIDYNIFLMTRVREESAKVGTRRGALIGLAATGGVITSAGVVLAATFTVLASIPIVFLAEMGFAVALGILLDTIVVRAILVTAINLDVGSRIWLPGKLSKVPDQELADPDAPDPELVEAHQ